MLSRDVYLAELKLHGNALLAAAALNPSAPVLPCPGWTMDDLVWHMAELHNRWSFIAGHGITTRDAIEFAQRPTANLHAWAADQLSDVIGALANADPNVPVYTWTGTQNVAWATRRMAHETAVHARDAQLALGRYHEIAGDFASDGIDEFLHLFVRFVKVDATPLSGSVHIHCTDVDGEWLIVPGNGTDLVVTREHAKGACAIRGAAQDILAVLWRRVPYASIEVIGDGDVAEQFVARTSLE
jgi:uncharacterized protein (TIGR03083 family)